MDRKNLKEVNMRMRKKEVKGRIDVSPGGQNGWLDSGSMETEPSSPGRDVMKTGESYKRNQIQFFCGNSV